MFILGAGLAGMLAGVMNGGATILEAGDKIPDNHHAVLRFRTDNISRVTGLPFKKVKVYKGIWHEGFEAPLSPRMANLYSRKVSGVYGERSILNLDPVERFIPEVNLPAALGEMLRGRIKLGERVVYVDKSTIQTQGWGYDRIGSPIINTIPLPILIKATSYNHSFPDIEDFKSKPVYSARVKVPGADIHQTIYYPDPEMGVYRASMVGDTLIVESVNSLWNTFDMDRVAESFGFPCDSLEDVLPKSEMGKLNSIDEEVRKRTLFNLSTDLNIWSLGRYACWRQSILLDDVYNDILAIRRMMGKDAYTIHKDHL
jgi:hypothetical protein